MHIEQYTGPLKEEGPSIVDRDKLYLITVFPGTGGKQRSFLGEWQSIAWDQKSGIKVYTQLLSVCMRNLVK